MTALVASLFLFSSTVQSEITYPVDDNSFVIDDVGVLNLTEAQELEQLSIDLSDGWGTDIVVVLIESTNNYTTENDTNMSLAQYTIQLFDAWGVGNQEWKDGVLIVLAINQTGSWEWSYEYGLFWQEEYQYIFDEWYDRIPDSVDEDMAAGDWANALYPLVDDLSWSIDDFWYENDGWVDPPGEEQQQQQDWSTTPVLDGQADGDLSSGDTLVGMLCCFGGLGVVGLIGFLLLRGGSGGGGGGGRSNGRYYGGNNHYGHHPQDVGYQQNNYYGGGFNDTPAQQQQQPQQVSGGNKRSRKDSGGSQRGSSTKRSGSSRSSGGSSRGGSSGRSSGGGSRRSGGGGGRRGGGRRGR
ncbi:MAG: hypothetical protein GWP25_08410 [Euryarchaeota archaeon]|nr:hypothetical protein [Euryarchaeota archaeon]